jgi:UDP-N-acetylmuramoyl-tripeptide--D-alanyl-D-alanine ligase
MATAIPPNRAPFTPEEIAAATGGRVVRGGGVSVGVFTDSRAATRGSAFVAIGGERFDGHAFLPEVAGRGASTVVVSKEGVPEGPAVVRVGDTKKALGQMARAYRESWGRAGSRSLVAITGSAGKTTTKSVLSRVLEAAAPRAVHASAGNLNNDIGVPMTLFGLTSEHRFAVVEVGTNARGEIANLASIALPDVAVLTLVAAAHTEGLGTVDDVAIEKGALFAALPPGSLAIANGDDARAVAQLARATAASTMTYGFSKESCYRIAGRVAHGAAGSRLTVERPTGATLDVDSPLLGDAGALAVAASLAAAEWMLGRAIFADELRAALSEMAKVNEGRLAPIALADGTLVIDDSYNANPASMRSSIAVAAELAAQGKRRLLLVLGEMRELGALSRAEHEALGRVAAERDPASVVAVGGDAVLVANEVEKAGKSAAFAENVEQAMPIVRARVRPGDVVLVKGSRSIGTEKIVRALAEERGRKLA